MYLCTVYWSQPPRNPDSVGKRTSPRPPRAPSSAAPSPPRADYRPSASSPDSMVLMWLLLWVLFLHVSVALGMWLSGGWIRAPYKQTYLYLAFVLGVGEEDAPRSTWQELIYFCGCRVFRCTTLPPSVHLFTGDGRLGCFCVGPAAYATLAFLPDACVRSPLLHAGTH